MKLSRKEAAKRIGISLRTLDRHVSKGKLQIEKTEGTENFEQSVTISLEALGAYLGIADHDALLARLGLPQEAAGKLPTPAPEPSLSESIRHPEPAPAPEISPVDQKQMADWEFAQRYLAGEITDSFGNSIHGGDTSALGPRPDLIIGNAPDSNRNPRYQPIRFHQPSVRPAVQRKTGYGVTAEDLEQESAALAARRLSR